MRKGNRVEELDLDQWILRVNVKVNVDHDVENDDETEDDDVWADTFDFTNHEDSWEWDDYLQNFNVNRIDLVSSSVQFVLSLIIILSWSFLVCLQILIKHLE